MSAPVLAWTCRRCGSHERRPGRTGCAECHRRHMREYTARATERAARALMADSFDDVVVTPAARVYLAAFDVFLRAKRDGLPARAGLAEEARGDALRGLFNEHEEDDDD